MKQIYELLPHQYAQRLLKDIRWTLKEDNPTYDSFGCRRYKTNPEYTIVSACVEILQGKEPFYSKIKLKSTIGEMEQARERATEIRLEHAKHVYLALRAGIKIPGNVIRAVPNLLSWAKEHEWDKLEIEPTIPRGKRIVKSKPYIALKEEEDVYEERFSKEDVRRDY